MRALLLAAALVGCTSEKVLHAPPQESCAEGALLVLWEAVDGTGSSAAVSFPDLVFEAPRYPLFGSFTLTSPLNTDRVEITFQDCLIGMGEVDARGTVEITAPEVALDDGNCASDQFPGRVSLDGDGRGFGFVLRDLKHQDFCGTSQVTPKIAGCYRTLPAASAILPSCLPD